MKVILNEKIRKLGNIGDIVDVATGYARNYLLPTGRAIRWTAQNAAVFESKKAGLIAKQEAAKKTAESLQSKVAGIKLHMIRSAGDTGQLYGSVSSRDIAKFIGDALNIKLESNQILMGSPIKTIGVFETSVVLHADVVVPVKVYVAQTAEEIDALVAGKKLTFGTKKIEEEPAAEPAATEEPVVEKSATEE
ncbi:MAG: 50S ribosomal protein L9 [Rickettsiales bacterium]|jgi:large subunit ribosomal protein L9|nr:50S ribosomal protein L9 [Rickettsiales bacterium]